MVHVHLDYSDGSYSARRLDTTEDAERMREAGNVIVVVDDRTWMEWQAHCEAGAVWQALWRSHDNAAVDHRTHATGCDFQPGGGSRCSAPATSIGRDRSGQVMAIVCERHASMLDGDHHDLTWERI